MSILHLKFSPSNPEAHPPSTPAVGSSQLTQRQSDCARLLVQGCTRREIARELGISVSTVDKHFAAIKRSLAVTSMHAVIAKLHALAGRDEWK